MDWSSVVFIHFIEFINETNSLISQNHSSSFKDPFSGLEVLLYGGGKSNGRSTFTSSVDSFWETILNGFKKLRFSHSGIAQNKYINVSSDFVFLLNVFRNTSKHRKGQSKFDVLVLMNRWSDRVLDDFFNIGFSCVLFNSPNDSVIKISVDFGHFSDIICLNNCLKNWEAHFNINIIVILMSIYSNNLNFVTRLCEVDIIS